MAPDITVTALALTPVKGMRLRSVDRIELGEHGARGDRSFFIVDADGKMVNGKQHAALQAIVPAYDPDTGELALTFPDGRVVRDIVAHGEPVTTRFYRRTGASPQLRGPWSAAVSEFIGHPLRLVAADSAVDRGREGATSLVSRGSLRRLAEIAEVDAVDARRFRMLIEIDGVAPHAEDGWVGRRVRVGEATIRLHGHVGRCLITSCDPETGETTLPTLELLRSYRADQESTEPLPFGVHGEVVAAGAVRIGDAVQVAD